MNILSAMRSSSARCRERRDGEVPAQTMFPTYTQWLAAAEAATTSTPSKADTRHPAAATPLPVLVIGAGPAGLSVMAELASRSIPFTCMEQSSDVGGMWDRTNNLTSPVYSGLSSNVSRFSMTLRKPFRHALPVAPCTSPHQLVLSYLQSFAAQHRLRPHIRFAHRVQHCAYDHSTQRWLVPLHPHGRRRGG